MSLEMPSIERLRELLGLDATTGDLYWLVQRSRTAAGAKAGFRRYRYVCIQIDGRDIAAHRVVFAMAHGRWPNGDIDHINGVRHDNRPENLREATRAQNISNQTIGRRNTSGFKGVSWDRVNLRWEAAIKANGKCFTLGRFDSREEAAAAYDSAAIKLHGEFAATNAMLMDGVR